MKFELEVLAILGFILLGMVATQLVMGVSYFTHLGMTHVKWGIIGTFMGIGIKFIFPSLWNKLFPDQN